jgi:hypothetical protein
MTRTAHRLATSEAALEHGKELAPCMALAEMSGERSLGS